MRWLLLIFFSFFFGSTIQASAQSILEIAAGLKFCRTLKDDAQRLKCFDNLVPEKPAKTDSDSDAVERKWTITEDKSPVDDSPQVSGLLLDKSGEVGLVLRCKEKKTEAVFGPRGIYLGSNSISVLVRINDSKPIKTTWTPSVNGQAAFAPSAVQFIRALPDSGKLFVRATGYGGRTADGEFTLSDVSVVREKIAKACNWPGEK